MRRVLIAAGGTGGHFYPGLVVAQTMRSRGWEPLMIVRKGDPAGAVLDREGIAFLEIDLNGLPRRPGWGLLVFIWKLAASLRLLSKVGRSFRPDLVLGMGGYLTFPLIFTAWRLGVPRAIHESNATLGLANNLSRVFGAALFWGLPPAANEPAAPVVGTPIRPAIWTKGDARQCRLSLGIDPERATILVFGGSQGASGLNAALAAAASPLNRVQILLLSGKGKAQAAAAALAGLGARVHIREYLDHMEAAYGAADVVVCRAGASTLAELLAQRSPSILVPYPHASANHQEVNARVVEACGAAVCIPERELTERLGPTLANLFDSASGPSLRESMSRAYAHLSIPAAPQAVSRFIECLEELIP